MKEKRIYKNIWIIWNENYIINKIICRQREKEKTIIQIIKSIDKQIRKNLLFSSRIFFIFSSELFGDFWKKKLRKVFTEKIKRIEKWKRRRRKWK